MFPSETQCLQQPTSISIGFVDLCYESQMKFSVGKSLPTFMLLYVHAAHAHTRCKGRILIFKEHDDDGNELSEATVKYDEEIIVPPLLIGSQSPATVLDTWMHSTEKFGIGITALCEKFPHGIVHMSGDSCAGNVLLLDSLESVLPDICILFRDMCNMHYLNSIMVSHFKNSWIDVDSMFAMTKIVHISSYWDQLV